MEKLPKFKKRKARSPPVLDTIDIYILHFISQSESQDNLLVGCDSTALKKMFKFTHSSLLIHLKRLQKLKLIDIARVPPQNIKKVISTTGFGEEIVKRFFPIINSEEYFKI